MRTFIALELPPKIKERLAGISARLRECSLRAAWVRTQNLHITLKFIGETDKRQLPAIKEAITAAAAIHKQLHVHIDRFGFFPDAKRPRVFFVSTTEAKKLKALADSVEERLRELGFPAEGRFKSHITLARIKSAKNIEHLRKESERIDPAGEFTARTITLFKSTLTPSGSLYEKLFSAELAE